MIIHPYGDDRLVALLYVRPIPLVHLSALSALVVKMNLSLTPPRIDENSLFSAWQ